MCTLRRKNLDHLSNNPYVNGVSLGEKKYISNTTRLMCREEIMTDLSKTVQWVFVDQKAAKSQDVKVGG